MIIDNVIKTIIYKIRTYFTLDPIDETLKRIQMYHYDQESFLTLKSRNQSPISWLQLLAFGQPGQRWTSSWYVSHQNFISADSYLVSLGHSQSWWRWAFWWFDLHPTCILQQFSCMRLAPILSKDCFTRTPNYYFSGKNRYKQKSIH